MIHMKRPRSAPSKDSSKKRYAIISATVVLLLLALLGILAIQPKIADKLLSPANSVRLDRSRGEATFPDIATTNLSPTRQKIISLAKTEFKAQSAGTKFSQGAVVCQFRELYHEPSGRAAEKSAYWRLAYPGDIYLA